MKANRRLACDSEGAIRKTLFPRMHAEGRSSQPRRTGRALVVGQRHPSAAADGGNGGAAPPPHRGPSAEHITAPQITAAMAVSD
jgi:hypothetical protein